MGDEVGSTTYAYDSNGGMTTRGAQTITWDVENRVTSVTGGASFVYDGDGNRVKKTEGGQTIVYPNKYYEKNVTTGEVTTYYFLGGRLVALRKGTTLEYVHQEHLSGTALSTDSLGAQKSAIKYLPFGETRSSKGTLGTARMFTGQRLDGTGLYFYNARYYDPTIGRFISPDNLVQAPYDPQSLNRYSYVRNNPLLYTDPTGQCWGRFSGLPGCGMVREAVRQVWQLTTDAAKAEQETAALQAQGDKIVVRATVNGVGNVANAGMTTYSDYQLSNVQTAQAQGRTITTVAGDAGNAAGSLASQVATTTAQGLRTSAEFVRGLEPLEFVLNNPDVHMGVVLGLETLAIATGVVAPEVVLPTLLILEGISIVYPFLADRLANVLDAAAQGREVRSPPQWDPGWDPCAEGGNC